MVAALFFPAPHIHSYWHDLACFGAKMPDRATLSHQFLHSAGWGRATRRFLAGDWSDRSYDRLTMVGKTAVLMDAPPCKGDDPADFVAIATYLTKLDLSAPNILAQDLTHGFLLIEDLGDDLFNRAIAQDRSLEAPLYAAATDVLVALQAAKPPANLPDLSPSDWAEAAAFVLDWYRYAVTGDYAPHKDFIATLTDALATHATGPKVMILRDYHAENLLWLPGRTGIARVGLLDFQLAQMGQPGYDLVSVLQDARRDVPPQIERTMQTRMIDTTGADAVDFLRAYAVLGAQRQLRIIGGAARLCLIKGKTQQLTMLPRVWRHLQRNLAHPALAPLATICANLLPEPTPDNLARIGDQCGKHPAP
jgi:N-acetylmuramate 1-kinase